MIHVAVAADGRYLPFCAVTIASCFERTRQEPVTAHVLVGREVGPADRCRLETLGDGAGASVVVHEIDDRVMTTLPNNGRFGAAIWFRTCLPELLPGEPRVLYLDADTLVVDDLAELWETDLGGAALGAVRNVVHPDLYGRATELGLPTMRDYFNSGVLLFDLDRVRADDLLQRTVETAVRSGARLWPDQDALNVSFAGRWLALHPRWNCMNSLRLWRPWAEEVFGAPALAEALASPGIVHFEGPSLHKPWHYLSWHPLTEQYRAVLGSTPWSDTPIQDRTMVNRVLGRLPDRWRLPAYVFIHRFDGRLRKMP